MRHLRHADSGSCFVSCQAFGGITCEMTNKMTSLSSQRVLIISGKRLSVQAHLNGEQVRQDASFPLIIVHRLQQHRPAAKPRVGLRVHMWTKSRWHTGDTENRPNRWKLNYCNESRLCLVPACMHVSANGVTIAFCITCIRFT